MVATTGEAFPHLASASYFLLPVDEGDLFVKNSKEQEEKNDHV